MLRIGLNRENIVTCAQTHTAVNPPQPGKQKKTGGEWTAVSVKAQPTEQEDTPTKSKP
jgi:hypothetical protein